MRAGAELDMDRERVAGGRGERRYGYEEHVSCLESGSGGAMNVELHAFGR